MDVKRGHCWRCEKILPQHSVKCSRCTLAEYCSRRCQDQDRVRHGSVECEVFGPKSCNLCGKRDKLKECAGCNNAWYCNAACQNTNWTDHKEQCQFITAYIKKTVSTLDALHTLNGEELLVHVEPPVYIGNTIAHDFLRLEENEWSEPGKLEEGEGMRDYHVLSAGCGDLRNTVLTVASLPETYQGKLHVSLDDFDPFVMARNVMFLVMMVQYADRDGIAASLATIWYSVHISSSDYDLIKTTLQALVKMSPDGLYAHTQGLVRVQESDLGYLREVWEGWLLLPCQRKSSNSINLRKQRADAFDKDFGAKVGLPQYLNRLLSRDAKFMKEWFTHGMFLAEDMDQCRLPCDNPTLTGRRPVLKDSCHKEYRLSMKTPKEYPFVYCIRTDQTPFIVWDCLRVAEFIDQQSSSVMVRYHAYTTHLLQRAINFIGQERLTVRIFLANCLDFPNHHLTLGLPKYDRIFTSNLSDFLGLGMLLKSFKPLLNRNNKHSAIVTHIMNWMSTHTPLADVQNISPIEAFKYATMCKKDAGFGPRLSLDVNNYREYYNNTHWFLAYLRAAIMVGGVGEPVMDHVPKLDGVMHYNGMRMRNFRKRMNKVVPFQYRVNARKITMVNGHDRFVEWCLPKHDG